MGVITLDLNSCCRLCLSSDTDLISIFDENLKEICHKHLSILVCFSKFCVAFYEFSDRSVRFL